MKSFLAVLALAATVEAGGPAAGQAAPEPTLDEVLARASRYVATFEQSLSNIVAEERYRQWLDSGTIWRIRRGQRMRREVLSDFLLVRSDETEDWVPFRDVFEVDGEQIRERADRLLELFVGRPKNAFEQAQRITNESTRYNIGPVTRTVNVPTLPLKFLDPMHIARSDFEKEDEERMDGIPVWEVTFREVSWPTLIRTNNNGNLPTEGTFWINPDDGAVLRARLKLDVDDIHSEITVTYAAFEDLDVRVPRELKERYRGVGFDLRGTASYSRLRRFRVITDAVIDEETVTKGH